MIPTVSGLAIMSNVSETAVQQAIRLAAPRNDAILWRNNNGACKTDTGRQIRYGLGNDSHQINDEIKSSDLIGITRRIITPDMVGQTVGVFTSIEVKRDGWKYTGTPREVAQNKWLHMILSHGGVAGFARAVSDIWPGV